MDPKALSCIIGGILINLTLGTFYSIGNVVPYIASYMRGTNSNNSNVTKEDGTWITASYLLGQGIFIIMGSYIEQKFNSRVACIFGCVIHTASTFLTIYAIDMNILAVILVYGLGSGLGCGSSYMASIIAAQKWFPNKKGFFTGLVVAGFGFGGLVFAPLQTLYMNPDNLKSDSSGYFESSVYSRLPNLFLYMGIVFACAQTIGCVLAYPPPATDLNTNIGGTNPTNPSTVIDEQVLPDIKTFFSVFKHKIFYIIGLMMMLVAPGVTFINSLNKTYGQIFIKDDRFLSTVVALASVANALGRVFWGFIMDRFTFSICFTIKVVIFATLISLFPFEFILSSKALFFIWILGMTFGFSGTFVLFPVFIEQVFGVQFHGIIYGLLYILLSTSSLLTAFIIQLTIASSSSGSNDKLITRIVPCFIIATLYVIALLVYIFSVPVRRLERAIRRKSDLLGLAKGNHSLFSRRDLYPIDRNVDNVSSKGANGLSKENSLGSIVRIRDNVDERRIKSLKG